MNVLAQPMSTCVTIWIRVCLGKESSCWLVQEGTSFAGVGGAVSPAGDFEAEQRSNAVRWYHPSAGGTEGGGKKVSSGLLAKGEPKAGLNPTTLRSRPDLKSRVRHSSD